MAPAGAGARCGDRGFTLVELLVVLVILATASAAVMLAARDPAAELAREAERFAARAKAAQERAIVEARPVAVAVDRGGYQFRLYSLGRWQPAGSFRWGEGVEAAEAQSLFDGTGVAEPATVTLRRGEQTVAVEIGADGGLDVRR